MLARIQSVLGAVLSRLRNSPRLRSEVLWVVTEKIVSFVLMFGSVKLFTYLMGKEVYGEFNLALTALVLLDNVLLAPVSQSYLRYHHTAQPQGLLRPVRLYVLRWYAIVTLAVCGAAFILSGRFAGWFDLGYWSAAAAGLVFLAHRWRVLGTEALNITRQRKSFTMLGVGALLAEMLFVCVLLRSFGVSAWLALVGQAAAACLFALVAMRPFLRETYSAPHTSVKSDMNRLVVSFGLPYAALLFFQWIHSFADRYIVKALLGWEDTGLYAAAFQVSGVPFMLLLSLLFTLVVPVAYERAKDITDRKQLGSANRVLTAAVLIYLLGGGIMVIPYALWGGGILRLLTTKDFDLTTTTMFVMSGARYIQNLALLLQVFYAVHQRMWASIALRVIGASAVVPICWFFVKSYGLFGAALGSFIASALYALLLVIGPGGVVWLVRTTPSSGEGANAAARVII